MARRTKARGLYQRGDYWLDWDRRRDGTLRSPHLTIFWYDRNGGRVRSAGTRTSDPAAARAALDRHYLLHAEGADVCPTCGQRKSGGGDMLVLRAITDYLATREDLSSIKSIRPRLNHVVQYIAHLGTPEVRCGRIDEAWVERFRKWLLAQPVVLTSGEHRSTPRSLSAAENSVIQLAAAINSAHARGDISKPAQFRPIPTKDVNRTPERRLSIIELSEAFRYASDPRYPVKRIGLHRFLILSVATAARPDAVHDFSTKPARRQWNTERGIIALNPAGRRQTRKRRAIVLAPAQVVPLINSVDGFFVPAISVKGAWESMVDKLGWPRDGDGGMKLIRRSVSQLIRDAGTPRAWSVDWQDPTRKVPTEQIEVQLGHRVIESVTDLYAAFDPDYQRLITSAIEAVIDEIERLCPGAFTLRPPADRSSKEGA